MTLLRMVLCEIARRRLSFLLGVLTAAVAVGAVVGALAGLQAYDRQTEALLAAREQSLAQRVKELDEDIRRAMLHLGFTLVILPGGQQLADWYAADYAAETISEDVLDDLVAARPKTIQHLLPRLRRKLKWPETRWTVIVVGSADQVFLAAKSAAELTWERVPQGHVALGWEIHQGLGLQPGDDLTLLGQPYRVAACYRERGTKDDITIWMNLKDAQALFGAPGSINEILALETREAWSDLPKVRDELQHLAPGMQVIARHAAAASRTHARSKVEEAGRAAIAQARAQREAVRRSAVRMATAVVPAVLLFCAVCLGLLTFDNLRARRREIGTCLALGFTAAAILRLILSRVGAAGLCGGLVGFGLGTLAGRPAPWLLLIAIGLGLGLGLIGAAIPTWWLLRRDPATLLMED